MGSERNRCGKSRDRDSMIQERIPVEGVTRLILDRLEAAREG